MADPSFAEPDEEPEPDDVPEPDDEPVPDEEPCSAPVVSSMRRPVVASYFTSMGVANVCTRLVLGT